MTNKNITEASDANFKKEVIESGVPVFVDFFASWCGPCKYFANVLNEVAPLYSEKVKFVKVNVDESPEIAAQVGIYSVPTLMFYKNGKVEKTMSGALPKEAFIKELNNFVS
jgi:thioredoxin 1